MLNKIKNDAINRCNEEGIRQHKNDPNYWINWEHIRKAYDAFKKMLKQNSSVITNLSF